MGAELRSEFRSVFGREAAGVWFAPGRANLNGEHIDFHGGRCLPMALSHGTYVTAAAREDEMLRLRTLNSTLDDGVREVRRAEVTPAAERAEDTAEAADDWTRYVSGVLWSLERLGEEHPEFSVSEGFGADVLVRSTLPIGGGLSSSAALECASALAFTALATPLGLNHRGRALNTALNEQRRALLARTCMRAEVEVVGAGTGGLDQTVSLRGAAGHLLSLDCRDFSVERLSLHGLLEDHAYLAVDTGQAHWLGDGQFGARRADAEAATELLGLDRLRDALPEDPDTEDVPHVLSEFDRLAAPLAQALPAVSEDDAGRSGGALHSDGTGGADPGDAVRTGQTSGLLGRDLAACRRRLRHALTEMVRSEQLHRILDGHEDESRTAGAAADADRATARAGRIGELMSEGHASMRDDAEVSFELADSVVEAAISAGALGARLIGGGFGGSVLALVPRTRLEAVVAAVSALSPEIRTLEPVPSAPGQAL